MRLEDLNLQSIATVEDILDINTSTYTEKRVMRDIRDSIRYLSRADLQSLSNEVNNLDAPLDDFITTDASDERRAYVKLVYWLRVSIIDAFINLDFDDKFPSLYNYLLFSNTNVSDIQNIIRYKGDIELNNGDVPLEMVTEYLTKNIEIDNTQHFVLHNLIKAALNSSPEILSEIFEGTGLFGKGVDDAKQCINDYALSKSRRKGDKKTDEAWTLSLTRVMNAIQFFYGIGYEDYLNEVKS